MTGYGITSTEAITAAIALTVALAAVLFVVAGLLDVRVTVRRRTRRDDWWPLDHPDQRARRALGEDRHR